jgi:proton-dependent oligopeptide transporter, POT family
MDAAKTSRFPPQIPFIIGNEAAERFSFYGMKNILTQFLVMFLLVDTVQEYREAEAKEIYHVFVMGVYFFPLLGGWAADRFFGKYRTIFWLSLLYCGGHLCLALFEDDKAGFYAGLFLIALGSGGIKPCVSSFVGDQFDRTNKDKARVVFDAFYWSINFGSFLATILMPVLLKSFGASVAFGVPGIFMAIATIVFWAGRHKYVVVPPSPPDPHSFARVARTALFRKVDGEGRPGLVLAALGVLLGCGALASWNALGALTAIVLALVVVLAFAGVGCWWQLERARAVHPDEAVEGVRAVLRVLVVFAFVTPFWSLFDQKGSTWVLQAKDMARPEWFAPSHMQALNPFLVMLLVPFNNLVLYPWLQKRGAVVTALRKMTWGIAISGLSWIAVGGLQLAMDGGRQLSILWQILPFAILTFAEILVSTTGLEFAYSQAPQRMKGVIMSFWSFAVTTGNLWVLLVNVSVKRPDVVAAIERTGVSSTTFQMFFFAFFAFAAAAAFGVYARTYRLRDEYRSGT